MSYSRLVKLNKIKEDALSRGDQETADKAQQFMDDLQQESSLAVEEVKGLSEPIVEEQQKAQSTYNKNLDRSKRLDRIIQKAEKERNEATQNYQLTTTATLGAEREKRNTCQYYLRSRR